jgi:hypothetical protein
LNHFYLAILLNFKKFSSKIIKIDDQIFFQNMSQINGFKGFVGFNIRELDSNETHLYCSKNMRNKVTQLPLIQKRINFTSDFLLRSYTSGCYYYDIQTGKWSSNGMEIYEDTNLEQTHCSSSHLTSFAGGLSLTPSIINTHLLMLQLVKIV